MSLFLAGGDWNPLALPLLIPGSCISVLIQVAMGSAFAGLWGTPPFTFPFIFMTMILIGAMGHSTYFRPVAWLQPALGGAVPAITDTTAGTFFAAWMNGVGQIYFCSSPYSGVLFVVAMAIYSRVAALGLMIGSLIGLGCAYSLGAPTADINAGLWGYNPSLLMVAVWTFYMVSDSLAPSPTNNPVPAHIQDDHPGRCVLDPVVFSCWLSGYHSQATRNTPTDLGVFSIGFHPLVASVLHHRYIPRPPESHHMARRPLTQDEAGPKSHRPLEGRFLAARG
jgi:hypothetical protein